MDRHRKRDSLLIGLLFLNCRWQFRGMTGWRMVRNDGGGGRMGAGRVV
jgi:hypothetical protein